MNADTCYWCRNVILGNENLQNSFNEDLHVFGGVLQNNVESVLAELLEEGTERKDQLLEAETERMGVYGNERLLTDRRPRSGILDCSCPIFLKQVAEILK